MTAARAVYTASLAVLCVGGLVSRANWLISRGALKGCGKYYSTMQWLFVSCFSMRIRRVRRHQHLRVHSQNSTAAAASDIQCDAGGERQNGLVVVVGIGGRVVDGRPSK